MCKSEKKRFSAFSFVFFFSFSITPQVFALTRITHIKNSTRVSCICQSCAPAPSNVAGGAQAPRELGGLIMVKRKLTVGGLIGHLASVERCHERERERERARARAGAREGRDTRVRVLPPPCPCPACLSVCVYFCPTCNFFMEYNPRFSVAPFQDSQRGPCGPRPACRHFPNKTV